MLKSFLTSTPPLLLILIYASSSDSRSLSRSRRAFSYIANQTVCVVDSIIYRDGDPIPTDDPCESCKCRPPGFSCVLRECEVKPGCKAIRRDGECCPEYQCGCEHNGKFFNDGDRIPNAESPCYSCYCQGSSITCALADCKFRFDCEPEYVAGECCPRYDHCPPEPTSSTTPGPTTLPTTIRTTLSTPTTSFSPNPVFIPETSQSTVTETTTRVSSSSESESPPTTQRIDVIPVTVRDSEVSSSASSHETFVSVEATTLPHQPEVASSSAESVGVPQVELTTLQGLVVTREPLEKDGPIPVKVSTDPPADIEDVYLTTRTWVPDTSLAAEHKESDLVVPTTQLPLVMESLEGHSKSPIVISSSSPENIEVTTIKSLIGIEKVNGRNDTSVDQTTPGSSNLDENISV